MKMDNGSEELGQKVNLLLGEIPSAARESGDSLADYLGDHSRILQDVSVLMRTPVQKEGFETFIEKVKGLGNYILDSFSPSQTSFEGRREFVINGAYKLALTVPALAFIMSCASIDLKKDWSKIPVKDFDMEGFDNWYASNKLYNGVNPNLILRHSGGYGPTFKANVFSFHGATPGIDYSVHSGEEMVAAAEGEVFYIQDLSDTGRAGGMMVTIAHPNEKDVVFCTHYAHLGDVYLEHGEHKKIKRGQPIGSVPSEHTRWAKLLLSENKSANYVDPDNYGQNHSYMDYWGGSTDLEIIDQIEKWQKQQKQRDLYSRFEESFTDKHKAKLLDLLDLRPHKASSRNLCLWSDIEKFRYLETLYKINPNLFPNISRDHYTTIKKEFYANQPITLTLPLKKG